MNRRATLFLLALYLAFLPIITTPLLPVKPVYALNPTTVRFLYDGDGVRVVKIENGKTTLYAQGVEKVVETGEVTKYYGLAGKTIAVEEGNTVSFVTSDHLSSTRVLTDTTGAQKTKADYYPYGLSRSQTNVLPSRQYTSQINDEITGLYFYSTRYYSPQNGLFVSPDIIATNKTESEGLNRFAYTQANPIRFTDNTGRGVPCSYFGMCDRLKQLQDEGGMSACGKWDVGCIARHKLFSLVYQIPFIGSELAKNELTVDEKINAESASLIPGPAAMTFSLGGGAKNFLRQVGPDQVVNARQQVVTAGSQTIDDMVNIVHGMRTRSGNMLSRLEAATQVVHHNFPYGKIVGEGNLADDIGRVSGIWKIQERCGAVTVCRHQASILQALIAKLGFDDAQYVISVYKLASGELGSHATVWVPSRGAILEATSGRVQYGINSLDSPGFWQWMAGFYTEPITPISVTGAF